MLIAVYTQNPQLRSDSRFLEMLRGLKDHETYLLSGNEPLREGTDIILSVGGDGTFLSASRLAPQREVPVLGVNMGRMGFLSENTPSEALAAIANGGYELESRSMLSCRVDGLDEGVCLNEVVVKNSGAAMLGVEVSLDGVPLPTIWGDGIIVSTSSGSTAYCLSAGGPICTPDTKVIVIAPIAPHNLNVRPIVVPESTVVDIRVRARENEIRLSLDNESKLISSLSSIRVSLAQFSLKRLRLSRSNFIGALETKLFWGEDCRNEN